MESNYTEYLKHKTPLEQEMIDNCFKRARSKANSQGQNPKVKKVTSFQTSGISLFSGPVNSNLLFMVRRTIAKSKKYYSKAKEITAQEVLDET